MRRFIVQFFAAALLLTPAAWAGAEELEHNHDPALVGAWSASSLTNGLTSLSFEDNGRFILDQRSTTTLERQYMCGTWERNGNAVELAVKARKNRLANGEIEQAMTESRGQFTVIRATSNTLVLRINAKVFSFHRTA